MARKPTGACSWHALLALVTEEEVAWLRSKGTPADQAAFLGNLIGAAFTNQEVGRP